MSRVSGVPARLADAGWGLLTGALSVVRGLVLGWVVVLSGVSRGLVALVLGRRREGGFLLRRGLVRVAQLPLDAVLMLAGRMVSAVQVLLGLEPVGRRLTGFEVALLRPVFGTSLDYAAVRVKEGPVGVLGIPGRAFAHGDTVFIPPRSGPTDVALLTHELTHVWQHQHGGTAYLSAALAAQFWGDGYDWRKGVRDGLRWEELNPEQQAQLIEDATVAGLVHPDHAELSQRVRLKGWTEASLPVLDEALASLRAGRGAP
ncbi:DUF4157 domain-containing protein [Myxococcus sp. K38C18041901]|uniref:eCIS core domain-containing protein n=1 Tax=Myxococcus guangdongensis TaxID=2906760 RepID=UPI0020A79B65|nr:DUF4157 domain-containing protein [Myxococcus guangdongensis]MCP3062957.1 DUF4157 domain-containing protein [Myxococcus guangdongensis]